jgi:hypothetical protein
VSRVVTGVSGRAAREVEAGAGQPGAPKARNGNRLVMDTRGEQRGHLFFGQLIGVRGMERRGRNRGMACARSEPLSLSAGGFFYGAALAPVVSRARFVRRVSRAAPASACHICCARSFGRQL